MRHTTTSQVLVGAIVLVTLAACGSSAPTASAPTLPSTVLPGTTAVVPTSGAVTPATTPVGGSSGLMLFVIQPAASQAKFQLDEVLAGSPNTVVGTTSKVAGQIRLDPSHPADSQVGPVTVETGTLVTDNSFRNRAISNFILESGKFQLATFTPTALEGMPSSVSVGDTFQFTILGNLTIRDITKPVTFAVTVTPESADRITGKATATVQRSDFALTIPSVPNVADVSQQVLLELDFVAQRSG